MNAEQLFSIVEVADAAAVPALEVLAWAVRVPRGPSRKVDVSAPSLNLRMAKACAAAASFRARKARASVAEDVLREILLYPTEPFGCVVKRSGKMPLIEEGTFSRAFGQSASSRTVPMIFDLDEFTERLLNPMLTTSD